MITEWEGFYAATSSRQVRPLLTEVLALAGPGAGRRAVDLGCGSGLESARLLAAGWQVTAVDGSPGTLERVTAVAPGALVLEQPMAGVDMPPVDLVFSAFALPFNTPTQFDAVWSRIRAALRPGGWLAVNLFGERDTWAGDPGMAFHSAEQAQALLDGLDVRVFREAEADGVAVSGPKHWHTFDVIARR